MHQKKRELGNQKKKARRSRKKARKTGGSGFRSDFLLGVMFLPRARKEKLVDAAAFKKKPCTEGGALWGQDAWQ